MSSPAGSTATVRKALRRFRRNRRGSAAVEFALVAPIFFALLFAIIETAHGVLRGTGSRDRRLQDTGRADLSPARPDDGTPVEFKQTLCDRIRRVVRLRHGSTSTCKVISRRHGDHDHRSRSMPAEISCNNFVYQPPACSRADRRGRGFLSVAAVRDRARLQHRQHRPRYIQQQATAGRDATRSVLNDGETHEHIHAVRMSALACDTRPRGWRATTAAMRRWSSP